MARVVLAMSGGVDSSVAAALLQEAGHEVIGLFMRHGQQLEQSCAVPAESAAAGHGVRAAGSLSLPIVSPSSHKQGCCTAADAQDARRVADKLDIPFYAVNFETEFNRIIDYFVEEYASGRTPNPCVVCNNWLKFGSLCEYADSVGADFIATGHYARLTETPSGEKALRRGLDPGKDQSYVLFGIRRELLPRLLFPVGGFQKHEIRERAKALGLRVADKKDSYEICFVPGGDYAAFLKTRLDATDRAGEIVTTSGEVLGHHSGIEQFTIGQRKGLGVAVGEPRYVVRIEPDTRRVVVGTRDELARTSFTASRANWLIEPPLAPLRCEVKIRYLSKPVWATVEPLEGDRLAFELDEPQHGVAPGQAAVCYDGDRVLGGGWIE